MFVGAPPGRTRRWCRGPSTRHFVARGPDRLHELEAFRVPATPRPARRCQAGGGGGLELPGLVKLSHNSRELRIQSATKNGRMK